MPPTGTGAQNGSMGRHPYFVPALRLVIFPATNLSSCSLQNHKSDAGPSVGQFLPSPSQSVYSSRTIFFLCQASSFDSVNGMFLGTLGTAVS